jgi:NSS family neurotransmitter:Na+ symporter
MEQARAQWKSKFGFILAASGSAIGLGNIVFFPANAYSYGAVRSTFRTSSRSS